MNHNVVALVVGAALALPAAAAFAGQQGQTAKPTPAEIEAKAMREGPATPRIGYLTHKDPPAPHRPAAPVDPKLLQPLTQREVGMLYHACIAYAECKTAYSKAYEHNQALLKAQKAAGDHGQ